MIFTKTTKLARGTLPVSPASIGIFLLGRDLAFRTNNHPHAFTQTQVFKRTKKNFRGSSLLWGEGIKFKCKMTTRMTLRDLVIMNYSNQLYSESREECEF